MPSSAGTPAPRERLAWLRAQGLGVFCGLATVFLLALGSFVLAFTRRGASANVQMDDLRAFFEEPRLLHTWLYLLIPIMGLYAVNTLYATWHNLVTRWRAGQRSPFRYGAAVIHLAFVVAMLAHLVGGFWSEEREGVLVGADWTALDDGRRLRLDRIETDFYANGQLRWVEAHVEVASPSGDTSTEVVAFNAPLSRGWGSELLLLANWGPRPVAWVSANGERCRLLPRRTCALAGHTVHLLGVREYGHAGALVGALQVIGPDGTASEPFLLAPRHRRPLAGGAELELDAISTEQTVFLRRRVAAGTPFALVAALLLLVGLVFLGRRWIQ